MFELSPAVPVCFPPSRHQTGRPKESRD